MSDEIKHECGIALVRLLKPLSYYKEKYGSNYWALNKIYLLMEKQHNRGQDGAGLVSLKLDPPPGKEYIFRERSIQSQPLKDIFKHVHQSIDQSLQDRVEDDENWDEDNIPFLSNIYLGHLRYGTYGRNSIHQCHPFIRKNNWMTRNLIMAGNFNMTNVDELFENLINLGQHPREKADTVTVMERVGHFLDQEVERIYQKEKESSLNKREASLVIQQKLNLKRILKNAAKKWDGGYTMAGLIGHGDSFVLRDPSGIRPCYYYQDDELVVVASERPAIQTVFNVKFEDLNELEPGHAIIIRKDGSVSIDEIRKPLEKKSCSFERIYFSRGTDAEIYRERIDLGKKVVPNILKKINYDIKNSVFSFVPNTAETSYYGMLKGLEDYHSNLKVEEIKKLDPIKNSRKIKSIIEDRIRIEKIAVKDVKLRTFITEDNSRDELVQHVYDITYGTVKAKDNLVIIDDSIVRGTTLKESIIKILDRLGPKSIVIVSSAPQIRYPDCYGIDMAKLGDFIAFRAAIQLHEDRGTTHIIDEVYNKSKAQIGLRDAKVINHVKEIYAPFTDQEISDKIAELVKDDSVKANVKVVYQTVKDLHLACPKNLGDWYFTGNYPTPGGNRVVNKAFVNYYEGNNQRAY